MGLLDRAEPVSEPCRSGAILLGAWPNKSGDTLPADDVEWIAAELEAGRKANWAISLLRRHDFPVSTMLGHLRGTCCCSEDVPLRGAKTDA